MSGHSESYMDRDLRREAMNQIRDLEIMRGRILCAACNLAGEIRERDSASPRELALVREVDRWLEASYG